MLVVTIELWPKGDRSKARNLGTAFISNDMTGSVEIGNYEVMLSKWGEPTQPWRVGRVRGFGRLTGSPWELLRRAIYQATNRTASPTDHRTLTQKMRRIVRASLSGQAEMNLEEGNDGSDDNAVLESSGI